MTELLKSLNIHASPYLYAALAIIAVVVVAKIADLFVRKVLIRIAGITNSDINKSILETIHRPLYFTIILSGAVYVIVSLKPPDIALFYLKGFIYTAMTILWLAAAARISNVAIVTIVHRVSDVTGLSRDILLLIENLTKIVIAIVSVLLLLSIWEVNITPLLASAGIAGVAVALAAKDTIANFFGGISVFVDRPFRIGDYIVLDQGERGEVVHIGVRSTQLKTRDDIMITIPNSIIANTKIINESAPIPNFRVRIPVSVAYGSDIDRVQEVLTEIATQNGNVLGEPTPRVRFREFGESSLNFECLCWVKEPALRGLTIHELNCSIYKSFHELGIQIPFPQRDVHVYKK
ncbi:MAG TPA: mechanosensitive ion channel family protein [Nitrospiraceae bacterium]|nr:mechanosensitive ion channel family protein [Nitrospiraceae bacterium]